MASKKYTVTVQAEDGHHVLEQDLSYDEAKDVANDWLGDTCTWQGDFRAIGMYGGVLTISCL